MTDPVGEPGELIGRGRAADIYALDAGRVLRRYRTPHRCEAEAGLMRYLRQAGYPVPEVFGADGPDLVMERLAGPTMLDDLGRRPWRAARHARLLAELHDRLHQIAAPAGLRHPAGPGDRVVHLDLHPANVMLTPGGPAVIDWSNAGAGALIYMGTSPGHEGAKPSVPYLIQFTTRCTVAPLKDGTRYYFQVALLDRDNQVSARSAEVSAVPGVGAGAAPGPAPGAGGGARSGGGKNAQPTAAPLPTAILDGHHTSSSPAAGLIVLLAALSLAGTGGAIAIVLVQRRRRRHGPGYAPVPAPRRPHDDQRSRAEELNGPATAEAPRVIPAGAGPGRDHLRARLVEAAAS
ncbi:MAG TPA: phosphotransferase [Streptosporangiaceae bacterium]|nr:phosphotransferase [Streptosporangiaceae bacterium]